MGNKPDHTQLACLDRCEQEWVYRHHRHLVAPQSTGAAYLGQLVHAGVQALYAQQPMDRAFAVLAKLREQDAMLAYAQTVVAEYAQAYFEDGKPKGYDLVWNEGYVESDTECGLPDRCVRWHANGKLYAMDLKTTSLYISAGWERQFEHNQQVAMQLDLLEHVLKEPVEGFILDAVKVAKARTIVSPQDFHRYGPLVYSPALRAELRLQRRRKRETIKTLRMFPELAEKRTGACIRYNTLCPYFGLCKADPEDREALIQIKLQRGELKEEAWEPSKR